MRKSFIKKQEHNFEGDICYKLSPEMEFYSKVCTMALEPTFYIHKVEDQLNSLKTLMSQLDHKFIAKVAVYAREKMYLRTIPLVIAVELAKIHNNLCYTII